MYKRVQRMNQQRNNSHEIRNLSVMKSLNHEIENYSWGVLQDMIEKEVNAAFKLREEPKIPTKKEIKKIIKQSVCRKYRVKKLKKNEYWNPS